jgi:predicted amidohydrolase YtcJ
VDSAFSTAEAFAVKDGKFIAVGKSEDIRKKYDAKETVDAEGKAIYPGFIDAHSHFYGYGRFKNNADLVGTSSYEEVVKRVVDFAKTNKSTWIFGRGWDQNDWKVQQYPTRDTLDKLFPNTPIYLSRVDGHAALVNGAALRAAGFTEKTKIAGGKLEMQNGKLTGVLVDNAAYSIKEFFPKPTHAEIAQMLLIAEKDCIAAGLTTVTDAGLEKQVVDIMDSLQKTGKLSIRINAMVDPNKENLDYYLAKGPYKTDRLNVGSFKIYADGALGSRGACLLKPYSDRPDETGFLLQPVKYYQDIAKRLADSKFQMCTHAIGDSANRLMLNIYGQVLLENSTRRWRIEHAQVVAPEDIPLFGKYKVIPSVQPTHATSDMYWAKERLGEDRMKGAYAYKALLQSSGMLALGTDFPVEDISPIKTFYAAVVRQDAKGFPPSGFQMQDALTRQETLKGMTFWAAYASFEEKEKGSIEAGKFADFVMLDRDMMKVPLTEILATQVIHTWLQGEKLH